MKKVVIIYWGLALCFLVAAYLQNEKDIKIKQKKETGQKRELNSLTNENIVDPLDVTIFRGLPYNIFRDSSSNVSLAIIESVIREAHTTETSFGVLAGCFLKNICFVYDEEKSYFDPTQPNAIFVTSVLSERITTYEDDNDYHMLNVLKFRENTQHELCHLLDNHYKFSEDEQVEGFTQWIYDQGKAKEMITFLYTELAEGTSFSYYINQKYLNNHEECRSISWSIGFSEGIDFSSSEIFAQLIATLDSDYWEKELMDLKKEDEKTYNLYRELLIVTKTSIMNHLENKNAPIILLLEKRIQQLQKQNPTAMLGIFFISKTALY